MYKSKNKIPYCDIRYETNEKIALMNFLAEEGRLECEAFEDDNYMLFNKRTCEIEYGTYMDMVLDVENAKDIDKFKEAVENLIDDYGVFSCSDMDEDRLLIEATIKGRVEHFSFPFNATF